MLEYVQTVYLKTLCQWRTLISLAQDLSSATRKIKGIRNYPMFPIATEADGKTRFSAICMCSVADFCTHFPNNCCFWAVWNSYQAKCRRAEDGNSAKVIQGRRNSQLSELLKPCEMRANISSMSNSMNEPLRVSQRYTCLFILSLAGGSSINTDEMYNVENTIIRHRHVLKILYCMINDQIFATSAVVTESSTTWCWPFYGRRADYGNTKIAHPALNYTVMVKLFTAGLCWMKEDVICIYKCCHGNHGFLYCIIMQELAKYQRNKLPRLQLWKSLSLDNSPTVPEVLLSYCSPTVPEALLSYCACKQDQNFKYFKI